MINHNLKQSDELHHKIVNFSVKETEHAKINGVDVGVIKGFASTYNNIDRGNDVILPGAFADSLKRHRDEDRQIRMFFQHNQMFPIGGFPIKQIADNEKGLFVVGNINLKADKGLSTFELIKQGVITDLSIGFSVNKNFIDEEGVNNLTDVSLWEISAVTEPMNTQANILEVKGATTFRDYPIAPRGTVWNGREAIQKIRKFTGSEDKPSRTYRNAFMWFDEAKADNFTAYKMPYVDVIDGKLTVVPRKIFTGAGEIHGARGGLDVPEADRAGIIRHLNKYYDKMGLPSPLRKSFDDDSNIVYDLETIRDVERFLKHDCFLSSNESKTLISKIKSFERDAENEDEDENETTNKRDADLEIHKKISRIEFRLKLKQINSLL